jgi:hypothetical protein
VREGQLSSRMGSTVYRSPVTQCAVEQRAAADEAGASDGASQLSAVFYRLPDRSGGDKRPMTPHDFVGKNITLLLMGHDSTGADDWAVFRSTVVLRQGQVLLECATGALEFSDDWVSRIRHTEPGARDILLGGDYFLPLTVGHVTDEEAAALERTGLRWPGSTRTSPART